MTATAATIGAPAQQNMDAGDGVSSVSLTRQDLQTKRMDQIARLFKVEFADSKPFCCCCYDSEAEVRKTMATGLSKACDAKLEVFGCAVDAEGDLLGYIMLGLSNTDGDISFPYLLRQRVPQGKCHLEQIIVCEKARGKGLAKKMMLWADAKAQERGCKSIYLEVIGRNAHAKMVYEKAGYVVTNGFLEKCCMCPFYCLLARVPYLNIMEKTYG